MAENKLLLEAQLLIKDNKDSEAILKLEQILSIDPKSIGALRYLALAYVQQKQYDDAILTFKKALEIVNEPILNMNLANVYKMLKQYADAVKYYQEAINLNPKYAKAHNNLAGLYAEIDEYDKALYHYKEALHADPGFTLAHLNLGILLFRKQEISAALTQFNNVLAIDENNLLALFYLGLLNLAEEKLAQSLEFFQKVLQINPEHVESLVNIGVILLKQNKQQLAIDYFTKALAFDENNIEARNNLAATFIHNDRYENALTYYLELLKESPKNTEYLYNTGVAHMGLGHIDDAINMFKEVLSIDAKHFGALSNLAVIKMRNRDRDGAIELLKQALAIEPTNKTTRFMLQALSQQQVETCKEYARDLFDHYALYYDKHMQDTLQYKLPQKLWEILHKLKLNNLDSVLDLGCGTGLCGEILGKFANELTGVDISEKMLAIASSKSLYKHLIAKDINLFLSEDTNLYDLIVALDVVPYFGDLQDLFNNIVKRLSKNGIFIFSTEISDKANWQVQESMRFSHSCDYIVNLCTQYDLRLEFKERIIARRQDNQNLEEMFYVCKLKTSLH